VSRWTPPAALALIVALFYAAHAGVYLRLVYPCLAIALGFYLEASDPGAYVRFVLWVWALSPFVRRLSDFQAGWQDPSLIILTPYLVTAICVAQLVIRSLILRSRPLPLPPGRMMFMFIVVGAAVGLPLGLIAQPSAAALEGLNWLLPPLFGWWLASNTKAHLFEMEAKLTRTFFEIGTLAGAYALYQFVAIPPWDAEWMRNVEMTSIGIPEPFAVRVFGTLHAPGVLAMFLLVPAVLWLSRPTLSRLPAVCLVSAALLLSQVRAAWIGVMLSGCLLMLRLPGRARLRTLLLVPVAALVVLQFISSPDASEVASRRLATFADPAGDDSALSRLSGHVVAFDYAVTHPFGGGIGVSDPRLEEFMGKRDSVLVAALVQFGIAGAAIYLIGFCGLIAIVWQYSHTDRAEALGLGCAGIGLLSTALFGTATAPAGVVLWTIGGLAAGSRARSVALLFAPPRTDDRRGDFGAVPLETVPPPVVQ
jgi:hypothetical protein